ncbi:DUF1512 domain-containing protein [Methanobacterium sp. CWC-01]|jgi:hypothetical protein|uniref:DUF1512 family protein n=1 Tax=Methanobacterium aridiramus TaxID=2584467 RepID=UPI002577EA19|nr:DUF1512 family protein [Methanobacterium sp. CWC-01]WJI10087.1 DUF1512 domain-containing protein [Methanobacterium sp. CWC-01]
MLFNVGPLEIIGIIVVIIFILMLPRIVRMRLISSVVRATNELEAMVKDSQELLVKLCQEKGNPSKDLHELVENYLEFFVIPPVDLDPNGIVEKYRRILDLSEDHFQRMAQELAPEADPEWISNIIMTLKSTLGLKGVFKMVRHNLVLAQKTGNLQILLMLQMSLPLIMRIVKAQFEGTMAFSEGKPIGDGLGPLIAGMLLKKHVELEERDGMMVGRREMDGRHVIIARAKGPGARVGKVGPTITALIQEEGLKRIITVDAAVKLEGEQTGSIAEGIGVVIGGPGVDKWMIEESMAKGDLETDAVIVKMSPEEAISQMNEEIMKASKKALCVVRDSIYRTEIGSKVLVVGVGNSSGLPNIITEPGKIDIKKIENEDFKEGRAWRF